MGIDEVERLQKELEQARAKIAGLEEQVLGMKLNSKYRRDQIAKMEAENARLRAAFQPGDAKELDLINFFFKIGCHSTNANPESGTKLLLRLAEAARGEKP